MLVLLRRLFLSFAVVCSLSLVSGASDYLYTEHTEEWFPAKFAELHANTNRQFIVVKKETVVSPPDDSWSARLSIVILFKKGQNIRRDAPYMVVLKAVDRLPAEVVPILVRFLATKNYEPFTPLAWVRWDVEEGVAGWVLVGPPESFIAEGIFKGPPIKASDEI